MSTTESLLEETIEVSAPPARIWAMVSDLTRMASWSPQVAKTIVRGRGPVGLGTRALNINRRGALVWPTRSRVVRFDPEREIALRIKDNRTIWSFRLDETEDGGTLITQRRETPDGTTEISKRLVDLAMGGQESFTAELRRGMQRTLQRIKAEAEA